MSPALTEKKSSLFTRAQKHIPSGVNSPVRAFRAVGGNPVFVKKAKGAYLWDEAGKRYLDFCASWGPMLFGHAPAGLLTELRRQLPKGTSFGAATRPEVELAEMIHSLVPSVDKVRLVSSGTEAVMSAIRLARGFTGRKKLLKVDGGYHGHVDSLLIQAGSGAATFGIPDSAGIPEELASLTISIPFNHSNALRRAFKEHGKDLAAFIVEPVPANMGVVPPAEGYLETARDLTARYGTLLIFDEVITGFRLNQGGAQAFFDVMPDLTCLGKILGGGMPLAAFGGRADIMDHLAPQGSVYQAGTLSGNPLAVAASLWMLGKIRKEKVLYRNLETKAGKFYGQLRSIIAKSGVPAQLNTCGSMFTLFFSDRPVTDYAAAKHSDTARFACFHRACLKRHVYLAPSQFEANFISTVHTPQQLSQALRAFTHAFQVCDL